MSKDEYDVSGFATETVAALCQKAMRERDEADARIEALEAERDAAVARAEKAEIELTEYELARDAVLCDLGKDLNAAQAEARELRELLKDIASTARQAMQQMDNGGDAGPAVSHIYAVAALAETEKTK